MRLLRTHSKSESGSVLATTIVITFVIGATLASFLLLTQRQTFANARSQSWNHTMAVSEAGVEDALQMINTYSYDSTKLLDWAKDINAGGAKANYWIPVGANTYVSKRILGRPAQAYYLVYVTNSNPNAPIIRAEGKLRYDYEFNHSPSDAGEGTAVTTASVGTTASRFRTSSLERTVVVHTRRDGLWTMAMLADIGIDLKGNNISSDSFNSADPSASYWAPGATYGLYDSSLANANGDIGCNNNIVDSFNIGNANIMGRVSTGPGGTLDINANGTVGSETWVASGNTGIQPGYGSDDMNVRLNDVDLPTTTWFALPDSGKLDVVINGIPYKHVITSSGDYRASTLHGSVYVASNVNARVYLSDRVYMNAGDEIRISQGAERLTIYMGGTRFKLDGSGVVNETGDASRFLYFGLPSNTQVDFGGNAAFTGAIYANHADLTLGGGGSDTYDFVGGCVARSIVLNGHYSFHYDENLANLGPSRGFIPTTWEEI